MRSATGRLIAKTEGGVGWLIFDSPARRNAVSFAMWRALLEAATAFAADPAVRVVIVTGAGDKAFVSGADISEFAEQRATPEGIARYDGVAEEAVAALETMPRPTIAMIRGFCIGGGLDLALRCDLRIAAEDARFGVPAARLGLAYSYAETKRLVDLVGPANAKAIFYTARQFTASEALRMGLVNEVVAVPELEPAVRAIAEAIQANAPLTLAAAKRCVATALAAAAHDLDACQAAIEACYASADYVEGRTAFMEKRRPVFRGR